MQIVRLDRWQTSVEIQAEIWMTKFHVKSVMCPGGRERIRVLSHVSDTRVFCCKSQLKMISLVLETWFGAGKAVCKVEVQQGSHDRTEAMVPA